MRNFSRTREWFRDAEPTVHVIGHGSDSRLSKLLTLAAMSLGYGVVQLDVTIVNTAPSV
jgi:hypothetical protein